MGKRKKKRMSPRLKARRGRFGSPLPAQFKPPSAPTPPPPSGGSGNAPNADNMIMTQGTP